MTTSKFASAKEAKDARWFSRRHETAESRHEAFRYCEGGPPRTRRDRQMTALHNREMQLDYWQDYKADPPEDAIHPHDVDYKIRCCKREIRCLKERLGIEEE